MNRREVIYRARNALRRRGLDIGRTDPDCPPYGYLQLVVFPALEINCVIDVGASQGEFARHLRDYGYTGRIVSFEPISSNYEVLMEKAQLDGDWFTHRYALGQQDETAEMYVTRGPYWHSLLRPSAYGLDHFGDELEVLGTEQVPVRRLDSLFGECIHGLAEPHVYLKIDTQGYDHHVLQGASGVLAQIPALQTEISFQQEYEGMTTGVDMIRSLEAMGYALSGIYKVFRDRNLALVEADGVFVRARG